MKNPDYWKPGRPYLDAHRVHASSPTARRRCWPSSPASIDLTFTAEIAAPVLKDLKAQAPWAICEMLPTNTQANLLVNRDKPPFDNAKIRKAMVLAIDRSAFTEIIGQGTNRLGGTMLPPPEGRGACRADFLATVAGYGADHEKRARRRPQDHGRAGLQRRQAAQDQGLDPQHRDLPRPGGDPDRPPEAGLHPGRARAARHRRLVQPHGASKDYTVGMNVQGVGIDDPDVVFYETFGCGSERNYTNYCSPEIEKLFDQQSRMTDIEARKKLVWEIDKKLQEDGARPVIQHDWGATCWRPEVKGLNLAVNTIYNHWRFEDVVGLATSLVNVPGRITMKLYMHPVSTASRPVMQFIADNNIACEMEVVDILKGAALRAGLQRDQSQPPGADARGRRLPADRERGDPALSRREDRLARLPQGPQAARPGQRGDGLVQLQLLPRLGLRPGLSAALPAPQARRTTRSRPARSPGARTKSKTWLQVLNDHWLGRQQEVSLR